MSKDLTTLSDFWNDVPSIFDFNKNIFKGFSEEYSKILNGKCDFEEMEDKYEVELEVPGVMKDEIEISLRNENLIIGWSRKREEKKNKPKNKHYERSEGSFTRSFHVEGADSEKIKADLKNGVLKIVVPKIEGAKTKKIEIN